MNLNKTRRNVLVAASLLTALPLLAFQPPNGGPRGNRIDFLAGYLSLTDSQKTQATAIFAGAETASETVRGQMESARTSLRTAVKANASDSEIDRLGAAIGTLEGQATAIRSKAEAKFYALLTAEQKTRYDSAPGMGGDRGPRGGPRGGPR